MILPEAGKYASEDILALAGKLWKRTVRLDGERVRAIDVEITEAIAGNTVGKEELTLLLAAHHIFLFPTTDAKEGEILVASRNPHWHAEPPRFSQVIEVKKGNFAAVWGMVERSVEERNARLAKGTEPIVAVPVPRLKKIFLRAPCRDDLDAVVKIAGEEDRPDPNRPRYYTHLGSYVLAEKLKDQVLEKLSEGEKNRLRISVASRGNRLLYRAPPELGEKVRVMLEELDKKP